MTLLEDLIVLQNEEPWNEARNNENILQTVWAHTRTALPGFLMSCYY